MMPESQTEDKTCEHGTCGCSHAPVSLTQKRDLTLAEVCDIMLQVAAFGANQAGHPDADVVTKALDSVKSVAFVLSANVLTVYDDKTLLMSIELGQDPEVFADAACAIISELEPTSIKQRQILLQFGEWSYLVENGKCSLEQIETSYNEWFSALHKQDMIDRSVRLQELLDTASSVMITATGTVAWLYRYSQIVDIDGLDARSVETVSTLESAGYRSIENIDSLLPDASLDEKARQLIGRCMYIIIDSGYLPSDVGVALLRTYAEQAGPDSLEMQELREMNLLSSEDAYEMATRALKPSTVGVADVSEIKPPVVASL